MPDVPIGPKLSCILELESVPPVTTTRWSAKRKAQVVRAVQAGLLREEEVCRFYRMTAEELAGWQQALAEGGERGLCATKRARSGWKHQLDQAWGLEGSAFQHWDRRHVPVQ